MVYEELLGSTHKRISIENYSEICLKPHRATTAGVYSRAFKEGAGNNAEHFWLLTYTGSAVHEELAAHLYRNSTFLIHHTTIFDLRTALTRFLSTNIYGTGLVPNKLVQHIEYGVSESQIFDRWNISDEEIPDRIWNGMQHLCTIPNKKLRLLICVYWCGIFDDRNAEEKKRKRLRGLIEPAVEKLQEKGFTNVKLLTCNVNLGWPYEKLQLVLRWVFNKTGLHICLSWPTICLSRVV
jgi:hypothetical protein